MSRMTAGGGPAGDGQISPIAILVFVNVISAAFFGLCFYVLGVDNVLFKAVFAFYCLMIPLRLLADVLNRVTATKELRILGPINT